MTDDTPRRPPQPKTFEPNYDRYKRSKKHEERIAKKLGGRRLPNSGAKARWKTRSLGDDLANPGSDRIVTERADLATKALHVEHKRTERASMRLEREWLEKVRAGAQDAMKDPALVLTFEKGREVHDWIMVPLEVWQRRLGAVE